MFCFVLQKSKQRKTSQTKSCLNPQGFLKPLKVRYVLSVGLWLLCFKNRRLRHLIMFICYIIGSVKAYFFRLVCYCFRFFFLPLLFGGFVRWEYLKKTEMTITQAITHLTYCPVPQRRTWSLNVFAETPLGLVLYRSIIFKFRALRICRNFPALVCWHLQSLSLLHKWKLFYPEKLRQLVAGIVAQNTRRTFEIHCKILGS